MKPTVLALFTCLFAGACSDAESVTKAAALNGTAPAIARTATETIVARAHAHTPRLDQLRRALDRGIVAEADTLLEAASDAGQEAPLLRARRLALEPKGALEALRLVGTVREAMPKNPEVYATAAEIYAAQGAFETGWQEVERGVTACGESAELVRARGILWISRENGARKGLEHLERARKIDPDLPFVERALGQAHLLVAKLEAREGREKAALEHARASLAFDPTDVDARRFLADAYAGQLDFQAAIAVLEGLVRDGAPLRSELASMHKKAAFGALLEHDRPRALEHFVTARDLGLSDPELASGAGMLEEAARSATAAGLTALDAGDLAAAEVALRSAARYSPSMLAPRNHLGIVLFRRGQFGEAASLWRGVLTEARADGVLLPEPVHVNLALALRSAGEIAAARQVLDDYLGLEPSGAWREQTLRLRESLETAR